MPFVLIADSTGQIMSRHIGYNPGDEKKLEKEIIHLLAISEDKADTLLMVPAMEDSEVTPPDIGPSKKPSDKTDK